MSYKISIDLEPVEIHQETHFKATEELKNKKTSKYITKEKLSHIMKILIDKEEDLAFVRRATQLFRGEKITIEKK